MLDFPGSFLWPGTRNPPIGSWKNPFGDPALVKLPRTLLNAVVRSDRHCLHRGRRYESSHDVVEHKLQPEDRCSQIIGESVRLAIHPVPVADQALECQRELALRCCENLLGSGLIKAHKALFG